MQESSFQPKHIGHTWTPVESVRPCIISIVRSICQPGFVGRRISAEWILDYSFTPFGRYKVGSKTAVWKERQQFEAHLYPAGTLYWEDTRTAEVPHTVGTFIVFFGEGITILPSLTGYGSYARFLDPSQRLGFILKRIMDIGMGLGDAGFWEAQTAFCEIITLLNRCSYQGEETYIVPDSEAIPPISEFIQKVHSYLHEHLGEHITRKQLADHLYMSISALAHRYRNETGESPMNTLTRMRIHIVKSLLLKGCRLKAIADHTGFCDEYHLSKVFKQHEGISASEFRKKQIQQSGHSRLLL